jgi:hypothetical protein
MEKEGATGPDEVSTAMIFAAQARIEDRFG